MKCYIKKALQCFEHSPPICKQHAPSPWTEPKYGAKQQMAEPKDTTPALERPKANAYKK